MRGLSGYLVSEGSFGGRYLPAGHSGQIISQDNTRVAAGPSMYDVSEYSGLGAVAQPRDQLMYRGRGATITTLT